MKLSRFLLYVLLTSWLNLALASTTTPSAEYKPQVGQEGKDVIWVPTPESLIEKMLAAAKVTDKDKVFDLKVIKNEEVEIFSFFDSEKIC